MKKKWIILLIAALALSYSAASAEPGDTRYEDNKVKAVFIQHFLRYFQWPGDDTSAAYQIVFIGDSPLFPLMEQIAKKTTVNGRQLIVNRFENTDFSAIDKCHILFISEPGEIPLEEVLERTRRRHILTVSTQEGAARKGVAVNFVPRDERVTFEINMGTVRKTGLNPSSQLLKLAILLEEEGGTANGTH